MHFDLDDGVERGSGRIAGRRELAPRAAISVKRVIGLSVLGSVAAILVALAARPSPIDGVEQRIDDAIALYARGDRAGARAAADALCSTDPSEARVWLLRGMLDEDRKAVDDAVRSYRAACELLDSADPRRLDVLVTLADLDRRKGDAAGALDTIDKLARERGESGRIRHARVLALVDLHRFEEALSETRLIAEERFGGGIAKQLEKHIRSVEAAAASRDG